MSDLPLAAAAHPFGAAFAGAGALLATANRDEPPVPLSDLLRTASDETGEALSDDEIVSVVGPPPAPAPRDASGPLTPLRPDPLDYRRPPDTVARIERSITFVQAFFWLTLIACVSIGLSLVIESLNPNPSWWRALPGLAVAVLFPALLRVGSGLLIAILRVHQQLAEMRETMERIERSTARPVPLTAPGSTSAPSPSVPVSPRR